MSVLKCSPIKAYTKLRLLGSLCFLFLLLSCNAEKVEDYDLKVTGVVPATGPNIGGTTIIIQGTGLTYIKAVTVGGQACTGLAKIDDTRASCATPAGTPGDSEILVTNVINQEATTTFTYEVVPTLEEISPSVGPLAGGTLLTITGTGFTTGATVDMGGVACAGVTVVDEETITCTTGAHSVGFVLTTITNPDGKFTKARLFAYRAEPTVTNIAPTGGDVAGGTSVTVTGTGFSVGASVTIGGSNCTAVNVQSSTQLTCFTTAHAAGLTDVVVTNTTGLSGTGANLYTYRNPPSVSSILPTSGFGTGGTAVTITGNDFIAGATVQIGSATCTGVVVTPPNTITCNTGSHSDGSANVVVTNPDNQTGTLSNGYTYNAPPIITLINPDYGPDTGGTTITITGNYFRAGVSVSIGGSPCNISASSMTSITCDTTAHAIGAADVVVTNTDTQSDTETNGFTYRGAPTVTTVSPNAGPSSGNRLVTVNGTGFFTGATVDFGGSSCGSVTVDPSGTSLTCVTSSHADGSVVVTVTNDDLQSGTSFPATPYTYQPPPTITTVSPNRGVPTAGTPITITGTGFVAGASVTIGGNACTSVVVSNATTITCTTPTSLVEGPVMVTVTNADIQSGSLPAGFNYQSVLLNWDVSSHDFENTTTDLTRTYTLSNDGVAASTAISLTKTGTNPTAFTISADTCTGVAIPAAGNCTFDLTFTGASLADGPYSADIEASATNAETQTTSVMGAVVDVDLAWDTLSYDHGSVAVLDPVIFTLTNSGTAQSTTISIALTGTDAAAWQIDSEDCTAAPLNGSGDFCTVQVSFKGDTMPSATYSAALEATANAGGTQTVTLQGTVP